jgi:DNA-binding NtrC family response regulator
MPARLLILDDDPDVALAARLLLQRRVGEVHAIGDPAALPDALARLAPDVLLLDMNFTPGASDGEAGLRVLRQLAGRKQAPAVIVMTAYAEVNLAVQALKLGAVDFVTKPWDNARLVACVQAALAARQPSMPNSAPDSAPDSPHGAASGLLGDSPSMRELRARIAQVAPSDAPVLVLGENGVGKELVARALHAGSRRSGGPLLAVDMGSLPEHLVESELFGHRRGSFTDARESRPGRFVAARGGTLFLDEIGNLPLPQQAKLLAALERKEVTPLGADQPVAVDVRVVSATNLAEARLHDPTVFRTDLLYRLNTLVLRVPPLRERAQDVPVLVSHYLAQLGCARVPSPEALERLIAYRWPGNVRELRQACERAALLGVGSQLAWADFGLVVPVQGGERGERGEPVGDLHLASRERAAVSAALAQAEGNISQAARLLGLSRAALYRKLDKHGL